MVGAVRYAVVGWLVGVGLALAGGEAAAQCNRNCKAGQARDPVTGCCVGTAGGGGGKARCPAGQERTQFTAGHCCWPGQEWSKRQEQCGGGPTSCPGGLVATGEGCVERAPEPCAEGQERSEYTEGQCCWPGQEWSKRQGRCAGKPTSCPAGRVASEDECVVRRVDEKPPAGPAAMDWVVIPAGSFRMGSTEGDDDEKPVRQVTLSRYALARTETTVNQYRRCVEAGACTEPVACAWGPEFRTWGGSGKGEHPVNCVDWGQAKSFCAWAGGRLPTEAEWEYGARGAEGRRFPWGNLGPDSMGVAVGNFADASAERLESDLTVIAGYDDGYAGTSPVGTFPAGRSPFGLDDMSGNVWEWVADWHASYDASATDNPTGPYAGSKRVLRGGSFYDGYVSTLRGASRGHGAPSDAVDTVGFRCARSVP